MVKDIILIVLGALSATFGLKSFLLPNQFIDGGVTGIALILQQLSQLPLSLTIFTLNLPLVALGYRQISKKFALLSLIGISLLSLFLYFIHFPILTHDKLLIAVFGGIFLGMGVGLAMRGGGVIDGTEMLAVGLSRSSPFSIGDIVLVINFVIFSVAALVFGIEEAMYSVLAYFSAAKTVDFVISGVEEYTGVTIISEKSERIRKAITENLRRGVTLYQGKRGYTKTGDSETIDIVFTVVTRLELVKLKNEVTQIDTSAVMIEHTVNDIRGGVVKKRKYKTI